MSHPTWVRGLKRIKYEDVYDDRFVAPYVGAWIETASDIVKATKL